MWQIIATGLCVSESLAAAEKLAADGIDAKVINIHTIKPLDEDLVVAAAKECGKVVTVEEHSVIGENNFLHPVEKPDIKSHIPP